MLGGNLNQTSKKNKGRVSAALIDHLLGRENDAPPRPPEFLSGPACPRATGGGIPHQNLKIQTRMLQDVGFLKCGEIRKIGQVLQLLMKIPTKLPNGEEKKLEILVDTGAEANLVKLGKMPRHLVYAAPQPLRFLTANGQRLGGGGTCIDLTLEFMQMVDGKMLPELLRTNATFYEADIKVDAILSFPWMAQNGIGVFPHLKAMALVKPQLTLLLGVSNRNQGNKKLRHAQGIRPMCKWIQLGEERKRAVEEKVESQLRIRGTTIEEEDNEFLKLAKLGLAVEDPEDEEQTNLLDDSELELIMEKLTTTKKPRWIRRLILAGEETEQEEVTEKLREQIHKDYDGTALSETLVPGTHERGLFGFAYIPLKDGAVPTRQKPIVTHGEKHDAYVKVTQDWIDKGFIERPWKKGIEWLSAGFVVPKKSVDFPWRGVVDLRGPNSQTVKCNYPLPCIEDILVKQGANHMFSIMDLKQAFHQQPLRPESRHITCTHTPMGIFQWRVNVMGLKNAGIQFQQMMDDRFQSVKDFANPYIDDILVGTRKIEGEDLRVTHERDLRRVLELLKNEKLVADPKKCKFFVKEVEFCGHILGDGTRRPAPGKLMAIEKWEVPKTIHELRAFLGFTNYYSIYIKEYAKVVARLQDKLKVSREEGKKGSKKKISWDEEDQAAFEDIKARLCSQLVLQRVNPDKPFVLRTDASQFAVGATLEQLLDEERMPTPEDVKKQKTVPVAFMSRKLTQSQRNWVPREQETYAIIVALEKWSSWIGLQPVMVLTDHKALQYWTEELLDVPSGPLGRRSRWHQMLSKYDLTVCYIPGKENMIADILSRWAYPAGQAYRDTCKHGSEQDRKEVEEIERQEREEAKHCLMVSNEKEPQPHNQEFEVTRARPVERRSGQEPSSPPHEFFFKHQGPSTRQGMDPKEPPLRGVGKGPSGPQPDGKKRRNRRSPNQEDRERLKDEEEEMSLQDEEEEQELLQDPEEEGEVKSEGEGEPDMLSGFEENGSNLGECTPEDAEPVERVITFQELQTCTWGAEYLICPKWQVRYAETQDSQCAWPKGFQVREGRMYLHGKLCIPTSLQAPWIREHHEFLGHVGPERLWYNLEEKVQWADQDKAKKIVFGIMAQCETCQACQRPLTMQGPLEPTPIPSKIMDSVAIDMFSMPATTVEGVMYNGMEVCVDRHSGWIVAVPVRMEGLSASAVAKAMLQHQWRPFGIPSVITSDQGSLFANAWWQTMCARLGIKHAQAQAYNHRANGRAEMVGQQLMEVLRKIHTSEHINWVEALPVALDRTHDVKGVSGLSPYEILFGRERSLANLPNLPLRECEDATEFFKRMQELDKKVARVVNERHRKEVEKLNKKHRPHEPFAPGDKVWYRRPENSGGKMDTRWIGPARVVAREGQESYLIELLEGVIKKAPRRFLKAFVEDKFNGEPIPMFYHRRTVTDPHVHPDEYIVDKIIGDRVRPDGSREYLTKWMGESEEDATWEPINAFVSRYNSDWVAYCARKKILPEIYKGLRSQPTPQDRS